MATKGLCTCAANNDIVGDNQHARSCIMSPSKAARACAETCSCGIPADPTVANHNPLCAWRQYMTKADPPIRIICTKCPAVATIHSARIEHGSLHVWMECHGQHVWGSISYDVTNDLLFHKVTATDALTLNMTFAKNLGGIQKLNDESAMILRFLDASGNTPGGKRLHEMYEAAERNMLLWQEHVDALKKRMK